MIKMKCKDHPKYQAIMIPRVSCRACWLMWLVRHTVKIDGLKVSSKDM